MKTHDDCNDIYKHIKIDYLKVADTIRSCNTMKQLESARCLLYNYEVKYRTQIKHEYYWMCRLSHKRTKELIADLRERCQELNDMWREHYIDVEVF